jgi:hypothetical protein
MGRKHLFEFTDQPWLPALFRDGMTDYLRVISNLLGAHKAMAPELEGALQLSGANRIVDLGSGGGGPILDIHRHLNSKIPVLLTDYYPNYQAFESVATEQITGHPEPVDARSVPASLTGLRTVCNTFHHFQPEEARAILQDAFHKGQSICVFELTGRTAFNFLSVVMKPFLVALVIPLVRPIRWPYWFFTYLCPLLPLMTTWDAFVSHLRAYSPRELEALIADFQSTDYRWEIVQRPVLKIGVKLTALIGTPCS